jgi:hypothetical protein
VKLTDIQLRLLAPLRNTTTVERPLNLTRGTAGKVVAKLRAEGFMRGRTRTTRRRAQYSQRQSCWRASAVASRTTSMTIVSLHRIGDKGATSRWASAE